MSGHIVHYTCRDEEDSRVLSVHKTNVKEISCVQHALIDGAKLLFVASNDGRVEVLKMGKSFTSLGFLWEDQDRLTVDKILVTSSDDRTFVILAKANFCVKMGIKIKKGSKLEVEQTLNINSGLTKLVGMEMIEDKIVFCNQKSAMKICDISKFSQQDSSNIDLDISRDDYYCQGMTSSPSGAIFACVDNVSSFNDHLIVRQPGKLIFWTLGTETSLRTQLIQKNQELSQHADLLECYR